MAAPQMISVLAPATAEVGSTIEIDASAFDPAAVTVTWTATPTNQRTGEAGAPATATTSVGDPIVIVVTSDSNAQISAGATPGTFTAVLV